MLRPMLNQAGQIIALLLAICGLPGCTQNHALLPLENDNPRFYGTVGEQGELFEHQQAPGTLFAAAQECTDVQANGANPNYRADKPLANNAGYQPPLMAADGRFRDALPLSPGDLVEIWLEHGEGFNGNYVINNAGYIQLPVVEPVDALGVPPATLAERIELALIRADVFRPETAGVTVKVLNWAAIEVPVTGAVFQPGRVTINALRPSSVMRERTAASGDYSNKRLLSEAVRAASGVRPDAKLDQVMLIRGGWQIEVDLSGILSGAPVKDYPLIAGDQVIVPSTGCFQAHLVRPSQITPKGFRVFMSNLIDSAKSNSSAAVGRYSSNLPYGTRLLQAAVSANCVGGKAWTNAPRRVVLVSTNPINRQSQVVERSIEELMRQAHRDQINPYLMPDDAVACYDSTVTNLRDVSRTLLDFVAPFSLL